MRKIVFLPLLLMMLLAVSCNDAPSGVLSKQEMEDVLFDYHLTQGMIEQLNSEQSVDNPQRYLDAVFAKHGITAEQFDSSMVWYYRDGRLLPEIYANVHKRLEELDAELKLRNGSGSYAAMSSEGDTANIWPGQRTLILRNTPLLCCERFSIVADSTFHRGDKFLFAMLNRFTKGMSDEQDHYVNVALTLRYTDGTIKGDNRTIDLDGSFQFDVVADKEKDLASVSGYFYFRGGNGGRKMCSISDIALIRMHDMSQALPAVSDTVQTDSVLTDTIPAETVDTVRKARLNPEQLRQQVAPESHVKIRTAPEVRTRNSYGVRRSNSKPRQ